MGIKFVQKGDFNRTERFLNGIKKFAIPGVLKRMGDKGLAALRMNTPKDSSLTSDSWGYEIENKGGRWTLTFTNSNINDGVPIAIILQYGHGTRNGGWVEGIDYINPPLQMIFKDLAEEAWREVSIL